MYYIFLILSLAMLISDSYQQDMTGVIPEQVPTTNGFPKIIHRMFGLWDNQIPDKKCQDPVTKCMSMPESFKENLHSCHDNAPGYIVLLWDYQSLERFIATYDAWFLPTWKSYQYPVQRSDSARYLLLYHFGGMYLDIDHKCRYNMRTMLDTISAKRPNASMILKETTPLGYTNAFMVSTRNNLYMYEVRAGLLAASYWPLFTPYMAVMCSAGSTYFSIRLRFNEHTVDSTTYFMSEQEYYDVYLEREPGSSWHSWDGRIFIFVQWLYLQHPATSLYIIFFSATCYFLFAWKWRKHERFHYCAKCTLVLFAFILTFLIWLFYQVIVCATR